MTGEIEAEYPRHDHNGAEDRKRKQLGQRAGRSEHDGGTERDEVAGDMRREEPLKRKEAGRVNETGVEAHQESEKGNRL